MAFYMSFPVGCFHYFNQPEYFEKWVIETKKQIYPTNVDDDRSAFDEVKSKLLEAHEQKLLEAYEQQRVKK